MRFSVFSLIQLHVWVPPRVQAIVHSCSNCLQRRHTPCRSRDCTSIRKAPMHRWPVRKWCYVFQKSQFRILAGKIKRVKTIQALAHADAYSILSYNSIVCSFPHPPSSNKIPMHRLPITAVTLFLLISSSEFFPRNDPGILVSAAPQPEP